MCKEQLTFEASILFSVGSLVTSLRGDLRSAHPAFGIVAGLRMPAEVLAAAATYAASTDNAARHRLDSADRQSVRRDASTLSAQRREAAPT